MSRWIPTSRAILWSFLWLTHTNLKLVVRFVANTSCDYTFLVCFHLSSIVEALCPFSSLYLNWNIVFSNKIMDGGEILLSIVTAFISKWVPMNFERTKGSHDFWEWNQKIVYHKIWNPRACNTQAYLGREWLLSLAPIMFQLGNHTTKNCAVFHKLDNF